MKGHTHAVTGLAAGAATLPYVNDFDRLPWVGQFLHGTSVTTLREQLAWVAACGGLALLADWCTRKATISQMWGPLTAIPGGAIGVAAGGHRKGTHDAVLAPLAFGAVAVWAAGHRLAAAVVLALAIGMALRACHFVIPGRVENTVIGNLVLSATGAAWCTWAGADTTWLPAAVVIGLLAHIAGDFFTTQGVPVPVVWVFTKARMGIPLASNNTWLDPAVAIACGAVLLPWQLLANTGYLTPILQAVHAATA